MTLPIEMVSDVVCPWCFIGKRRLEQAIALRPEIPVEVRFHPFFLNPWIPRQGISREEYLTTKFGSPERYRGIAQRVAAAAAAEGLSYAIDNIKRQPNTLDCHRLILWAGEDDVERVSQAAKAASDAGINGVPCFVLGGVLAVQGAQSPDDLAQAIERAANEYAKRAAAE